MNEGSGKLLIKCQIDVSPCCGGFLGVWGRQWEVEKKEKEKREKPNKNGSIRGP